MNKFSVKKLLLTILCTVIVSIFIGSTVFFVGSVPGWIQVETLSNLDENSEVLIEVGKSYEENIKQLENRINEHKALYGEDYPSAGIFFYQLINLVQTNGIVAIYSMSFLIGITLGTIIYIVAIQNAKGKKLVLELAIAFAIIFVTIVLANAGYQALINSIINKYSTTEIEYQTYIYDLDNGNMFVAYIVIIAVVYVGNMIYQKIQANKLNKELNKK